jgi:hypothetical protein
LNDELWFPQQGALKTGGKTCGPFIRVPSKRSRDAGETIASAFATPPTWGGYAGRNFETELASSLVPGFPVPDPARGAKARERMCPVKLDVRRNARPPSKFSSGMQQAGTKQAGFVHR